MKLFSDKNACCGCGACADACPEDAIRMEKDEEGFAYPQVDQTVCTGCGRCVEVCPIGNDEGHSQEGKIYLGVQAKEDVFRFASSSGGMFSVLAQYIFRHRGIVYGAAYDRRMEVRHMRADNMEQLDAIRRTKYVQSSLDGVYREIEGQLQKERWVLFCGTPCQGSALRLYLKKVYPRLVIVDLVCYGVPSPGIWASYVRYLEEKRGGRMQYFSFRDKGMRDNGHGRSYRIDDVSYAGSLYKDIYCMMYFKNYILRPSCHHCGFCRTERSSDFTLGDFWGIERVRKDMDDGMGTSMVILHTRRAKEIWDDIKDQTRWFSCKREEILQPRLMTPTEVAKGRGLLMNLYKVLPFSIFLNLAGCMIGCRERVK